MAIGYLGSDILETSTANQELVPSKPSDWTVGYHLIKFSFANVQDCTIIVNGETIFIPAGKGFEVGKDDPPVTSFIIVQSGVQFNWAAVY